MYIFIQCLRPTPATALVSGRCCFLRGCGLGGVVLRVDAGFCSEHPERNRNMTPSRPKIAGKSLKRDRKSCFEGHWGSLGGIHGYPKGCAPCRQLLSGEFGNQWFEILQSFAWPSTAFLLVSHISHENKNTKSTNNQ